MIIKDIAFTAYPSNDVAGTRAWYEEYLGLEFAGPYVEDGLEAMKFDAWADLFANDAVQENPYAPSNFPSRFVGKDALRDHYASMKTTYASMRFWDRRFQSSSDPNEIMAEFRGDIHLANSERKYDNRYCCVFRFDAVGKIELYREYFNPQILIEAFADAPAQLHGLEPATS